MGNGNLIDGCWMRSEDGGVFEVREAQEPWGGLGAWPSSGPGDVERTLASLGAGEHRESTECRAELEAAARVLAEDEAGAELLARRLGLHTSELEHDRTLLARRDPVLRPAAVEEIAVVAHDWSELLRGPFLAAAAELERGRDVVLLGDPRTPMTVDAVARALLAGGVSPHRIALLHGLTRPGVERLLRGPRVRALRASGDRERIRWLRAAAGAGGVPQQELVLLRSSAAEVGLEDDLEACAKRLVARAFSRAGSLSGQRAGQVGRIFCHVRVLSRFTECFLAALAQIPDAANPIPSIDRDAARRVERTWAAGLDEGATLIAGGVQLAWADGTVHPRSLRIAPTVFTNVEPHMALARRQTPMPIVGIVRTIQLDAGVRGAAAGGEGLDGIR